MRQKQDKLFASAALMLACIMAGCTVPVPWPTQQGQAIYRMYPGPERETSELATVVVRAPLAVKQNGRYWRGEFAIEPGKQVFLLDFHSHTGAIQRWSQESIPVEFAAKKGHRYQAFYHDSNIYGIYIEGSSAFHIGMDIFDVTNQESILAIIIAHPSSQFGEQALNLLEEPDYLKTVAELGAADSLRIKALKKLDDPDFLKNLALNSEKTDIRLDCISLLEDCSSLEHLIENPGRDTRIRQASKKRLASLVSNENREIAHAAQNSVERLKIKKLW